MRARKSSEALKFLLTLSLMANAAAGAYWVWLHKTPAQAQAVSQLPSAARTPSAAQSPGATQSPVAAQPPSSPIARPRAESKPYTYWIKIRSLDAKAGASAAEDAPESLQGPPPGSPRTVLALSDAPAQAGGPVRISQQTVSPDATVLLGPESLRTGCCRIVFLIDADGARSSVVTAVSGTYHESCEPVADGKWESDRLALWRYQTADGHGGRYHYEVYLERRARG
jgi:hypothetical protein